jgi:hypothetical protein
MLQSGSNWRKTEREGVPASVLSENIIATKCILKIMKCFY